MKPAIDAARLSRELDELGAISEAAPPDGDVKAWCETVRKLPTSRDAYRLRRPVNGL